MPKGVHAGHVRGSAHYRWNHGQIFSEQGYTRVRVGLGHCLADPNGYAYEHLLVWVSAGNQAPQDDELIHYLSGDKKDNRIDNLALMKRSNHNALHLESRGRSAAGRLLPSVVSDQLSEAL